MKLGAFRLVWIKPPLSPFSRDLGDLHATAPSKEKVAIAPKPCEIEPLDGGLTIADIYSNTASLAGKAVSLRARLVKVSPNIPENNLLTLLDGTGEDAESRLMAVSSEMAEIDTTLGI